MLALLVVGSKYSILVSFNVSSKFMKRNVANIKLFTTW
jgi:hypothetical protein